MSLINSTAIPSGASAYELEQSLRFNDDDAPQLTRVFPSAGNRKTFTYSVWLKRGNISDNSSSQYDYQNILDTNGNNYISFAGGSDMDSIRIFAYDGSTRLNLITTQVFRDHSSWYHIMFVLDTTQGTAANRAKLYVNGVQVTSFSTATYPDQHYDLVWNSATSHSIGGTDANYFDGYLAEVNFIDGAAKAPADFGETGDYGEWKPIEYSGSYGTNGFYLPFKQDYTVEGFSTVLWSGTSVQQYIGGVGFQPDFLLSKRRSGEDNGMAFDSVRGVTKRLLSNASDAEATSTTILKSFDTDGFTVGTDGYMNYAAGNHYVAWCWDMGGSNANNTTGSINSVVRANPSYGQSIVSWVGNATAGASVGTGLSAAAELIIIKNRETTGSWRVHDNISGKTNGRLDLEQNYAENTSNHQITFQSGKWTFNSDSGQHEDWNKNNNNIIAYCFHSVTGYSKFDTYTGDGTSNGSKVITLGFEPAFVMIKCTNDTESWWIFDNARNPLNSGTQNRLAADSNGAETTNVSTGADNIEFTSTGFKMTGSGGGTNQNNNTYIYMAFADKREYAYWLDQSGNNNDWTSNNLTESDVMVDSPTNNFATLNPLTAIGQTTAFAEGNLKAQTVSAAASNQYGSMAMSSGKWYWEIVCVAQSSDEDPYIYGIVSETANPAIRFRQDAKGYGYHGYDGKKFNNNDGGASYGNAFTAGDIISVAFDSDNGTLKFYKNGTVQNSGTAAFTSITGTYFSVQASISSSRNVTYVANFGQDSSFAGNKTAQGNQDSGGVGDFYYTPPTGFLALCTSNLPDVAVVPSENFNTVLYTGNGGTGNHTGVGFQPDFVWLKGRNIAENHALHDAVRGTAAGHIRSDTTNAESTNEHLLEYGTDGFNFIGGSPTSAAGHQQVNSASYNYVAWNWKANGSGSSNTNGSINTTKTSANVDAGFSIITYTGNATSGATIGHGLSKAPEFWTIKERGGGGDDWNCYHEGLASAPETKWIRLNSTATVQDASNMWNDQAPTSSLIYLGNSGEVNGGSGETFVCYAFHSVEGYSKVGSYEGNDDADGTFIYTGFRPAFVMVKNIDEGYNWIIADSARETHNPMDFEIYPNLSNVEHDTSGQRWDFVSNGIKLRSGSALTNEDTYIYIAFAETPFKYSNAR